MRWIYNNLCEEYPKPGRNMVVDLLQVREQIKALGESAVVRHQRLKEMRELALMMLRNPALELERLQKKALLIMHNFDPNLRCALPVSVGGEFLSVGSSYPSPKFFPNATILAVDGSQIPPDRHAEVIFGMINLGAIELDTTSAEAPNVSINSRLFYDEELYTESGFITDSRLALIRDLSERQRLIELAVNAKYPLISLTDGPLELWGAREGDLGSDFNKSLELYIDILRKLFTLNVVVAGYVDKPGASLVVRLLEIALIEEGKIKDIKNYYPLRGLVDIDLFRPFLGPGERSTVFALQFKTASQYRDELALHFFYLNVGGINQPWLARIEIPAWVAKDNVMLDLLHAVLIHQCNIMGPRPYPYLLHRAHEAAVVSIQEKEQITQMISMELRNRGLAVGKISHKQSGKNLGGRTRYNGGKLLP